MQNISEDDFVAPQDDKGSNNHGANKPESEFAMECPEEAYEGLSWFDTTGNEFG
ncbi:MAG: hypothetical protein V7701_02780 [Sneathiella sp.]